MTGSPEIRPLSMVVGAGYLGTRVARGLAAAGGRVIATSRSLEGVRRLGRLAPGVRGSKLDLSELENSSLPEARLDCLIWTVAPHRGEDPSVALRDGVRHLLRALADRAPRRWVHVSATGVYAQDDGSRVDEASPARGRGRRDGLILEAEGVLLRSPSPPEVLVLRLGGIYGPGRSPLDWVRGAEFRKELRTRSAEAWLNWIHVDDAARAVTAAARGRGRAGIYTVVDGSPVRRRDLYAAAARISGVEPPEFDSAASPTPGERGSGARPGLGKRCGCAKMAAELGVTARHRSILDALPHLVPPART